MIFIADTVVVNGERITAETASQYFNEVGYISVFDPTLETAD